MTHWIAWALNHIVKQCVVMQDVVRISNKHFNEINFTQIYLITECLTNTFPIEEIDHLAMFSENGRMVNCLCGSFRSEWLPVSLRTWSPVKLIYSVSELVFFQLRCTLLLLRSTLLLLRSTLLLLRSTL